MGTEPRSITNPINRNGIFTQRHTHTHTHARARTNQTHSNLLFDLWSSLFKIDVWKSWVHSRESCHFVSSSVCRCWRVMDGADMRGSSSYYVLIRPFLLFIGKEQTNMAAPCGTLIWSKKMYLCYKNIIEQPNDVRKWKCLHVFCVFKPSYMFAWGSL